MQVLKNDLRNMNFKSSTIQCDVCISFFLKLFSSFDNNDGTVKY